MIGGALGPKSTQGLSHAGVRREFAPFQNAQAEALRRNNRVLADKLKRSEALVQRQVSSLLVLGPALVGICLNTTPGVESASDSLVSRGVRVVKTHLAAETG